MGLVYSQAQVKGKALRGTGEEVEEELLVFTIREREIK